MDQNEFMRAYHETTYSVFDNDTWYGFHIGEICPQMLAIMERIQLNEWAFISAYNPYSQALPLDVNQQRDDRLRAEMESDGYYVFTAQGADDHKIWPPEPSLIIFGIAQDAAVAVAKKYEQNAIVIGTRFEPASLVWTGPQSPT